MTTKIKAVLDHVGIAVNDLEVALDFFRDALGLQVGPFEEVKSQGVRVHMMTAGGSESTSLELLEATSEDSPISKFVDRRGPGLHHITFRVDNLSEALVELKKRSVRLIDEVPRSGAEGSRVAFIHPTSTHGVLVELKED